MTEKYVKHTTHTDALDTLGSIIGPEERRDAIHLAVFPVEAGELLQPGAHVAVFYEDGEGLAYRALPGKGVGIVDPFLAKPVQTDERFWLVVYPREIASLRHVWEHEAFPPSGEATPLLVSVAPRKSDAEQWLRNLADEMSVDFHGLIHAAMNNGWNDDYITLGEDAGGDIPEGFWDAMEAYTGQTFERRAKYFSCAC